MKQKSISVQKLALFVLCLIALSGCANKLSQQAQIPSNYVEAGTVTPYGIWMVKKELFNAGIVAYSDGSQYPLPYRILVSPEDKERASALISEIKQRRLSSGY